MSFTPFTKRRVLSVPPATVATPATEHSGLGGPRTVATVATVARAAAGHRFLTTENEAERAAIIEEGAKVPRRWADWFAMLDPQRPPPGASPGAWLAAIDGVGRTLDTWGAVAAAHGWEPGELFSLTPDAPFLFARAEVIALTAEAVTLRDGEMIRTIWRPPALKENAA